MPILVKIPSKDSGVPEWAIVEVQGDLEVRSDQVMDGQFVGDLCYNKYGQPIFIIGHHILQGREQPMEKPFAVLQKSRTNEGENLDVTSQLDSTIMSTAGDQTILDSTVAIENKSKQRTQYTVRAIVTRKLIFKSRPKPIIANVAKHV
ncbi:chromosome transmission fidelity protein 8 homolog [Hermetia illucens]|uniref:chromosome transmission fidelity protein 8 homolog n=1 Tax=Hermetia illucens TaxID=343691 RepID=UPI0018CC6E93|nr:chromosome transmission fidelity protein 8 homolog [Hermetia illucens]